MSTGGRALLLIGSPRGKRATSESLGSYLLDQLAKTGVKPRTVFVYKALRSEEGRNRMLSEVEASDIIIFAFPLYVDSLPAPVIEAMELIAQHLKATGAGSKKRRLVSIVNSGFPEPDHNETAHASCRIFATSTGMEYAGGLSIGGGGAIQGRPLGEVGGMARKMIRALDLTAAALVGGDSVPREARDLLAKPFIPGWLYRFVGNRGWKARAKKNGVKDRLYDAPYAR